MGWLGILELKRFFTFRSLKEILGGAYAVQWFFAAVAICGFGFALLFLPETHGKKLSEIQAHFSGEASKQKKVKKPKKNGVTNRKPKQTLETVQEAERMMKETVWAGWSRHLMNIFIWNATHDSFLLNRKQFFFVELWLFVLWPNFMKNFLQIFFTKKYSLISISDMVYE